MNIGTAELTILFGLLLVLVTGVVAGYFAIRKRNRIRILDR